MVGLYYGIKKAPYRPHAIVAIHEINELPRFIAHKGKIGEVLPNAMPALKAVMASQVDGIEVDIRFTTDHVPVVFHGESLDLLTDGRGPIEDKTYKQVKSIHYATTLEAGKEPILSLEDVFKTVQYPKYIFLDVKSDHLFDKGHAKALAKIINKYNDNKHVIVESFNPFFLKRFRQYSPDTPIMLDFATSTEASAEESQSQLDSIPWLLKQSWFINWINWHLKPDLLGPRFSVPLGDIRELAQRGYPLIVWTVDDKTLAQKLLANGVHGLQSNQADILKDQVSDSLENKMMDASGIDGANVEVVRVTKIEDIHQAIEKAKRRGLKISIAGRRHTQGGHTFEDTNLVLDMKRFNKLNLLSDKKTIRVESGATWHQIQTFLNKHDRAVKIMQSDNIFTVGGTVSVNAHGWQQGLEPINSSVKQFTIMLADGRILTCSRMHNQELFSAALGGYGLMGVIIHVDLETVPNYEYMSKQFIFESSQFPQMYQKLVSDNPKVDLAYGRFQVATDELFNEALLHIYYRDDEDSISDEALVSESFVDIKQKIFRNSQRNNQAKKFRWSLEKTFGNILEPKKISRNNVMSPDIHALWPLDRTKRDVLHEYFIPKEQSVAFISRLKETILSHDMNLLNVTIRELKADQDTLLNYATTDMFSFVLYFSQDKTEEGEKRMKLFTRELIDYAISLKGTFYLPYRIHYTKEQLLSAYPNMKPFLSLKLKYDPNELFTSKFYHKILTLLDMHDAAENN